VKSLSRIMGLVFLVCGCGDSGGVNLIGACEDLASAVADAAVRCEDADWEVAYQSYLDVAEGLNGSCSNVVAVRDNKSLYSDCIPALSTIECSDFITPGNLPPACEKQLIVDR
jgi:hypothetical protein